MSDPRSTDNDPFYGDKEQDRQEYEANVKHVEEITSRFYEMLDQNDNGDDNLDTYIWDECRGEYVKQ